MSDIRYRVLSDDDSTRLYRKEPGLAKGYENWCPTCDKRGKYTWQDVEVYCDCEAQVAMFKWYSSSGIGSTYQRLSWADYDGPTEIVDQVSKYTDNIVEFYRQGMGLYLSGDVGVGKTMVLNLVLKHLVHQGYTCFATTFSQMIEMYTAGWTDKDEKHWFQRKFLDSQFLLLDDVGKERDTKIALNETTFDSVLRKRVSEGRPTFITTNLDANAVRQGYGASILSLIGEQSVEEVITGEDYRPQANKRRVQEVLRGWTRPITHD